MILDSVSTNQVIFGLRGCYCAQHIHALLSFKSICIEKLKFVPLFYRFYHADVIYAGIVPTERSAGTKTVLQAPSIRRHINRGNREASWSGWDDGAF